MDSKKIKHVQTLFRNIREMSLREIKNLTGRAEASISLNENLKIIPGIKTIFMVSEALEINPKILFYSYGMLPDKIQVMIRSDPFYYMEKIEKLYYNHEKRYGSEEFDLNKLNASRAFEYIVKEDKNDKD